VNTTVVLPLTLAVPVAAAWAGSARLHVPVTATAVTAKAANNRRRVDGTETPMTIDTTQR
jgi:hypothetical protein